MKKIRYSSYGLESRIRKLFLVRKLTIFIFFLGLMSLTASTYSQTKKFSFELERVTLSDLFKQIESQSEFVFIYKSDAVDLDQKVNVNIQDVTVDKILENALQNTGVKFEINKKQIIITPDRTVTPSNVGNKVNETAPQPQKKEISGTVKDNKGLALPGVSVVVKGTTTGTMTDTNGNFKLALPENAKVISYSFVGMKTQEVAIEKKTTFNITLAEETFGLDEVVAVGYTTQSRHKMTSAVATVSGEELTKREATDPQTLLQGQLPGLQVVQNSGEPGNEGVTMTIRGISTFSGAGNNPLIIIDGLPGNLSVLNPNDIESVSLLKDAASAAIYGSRGANGVIVITTKAGKAGKFSLTYNYNLGIANATSLPDIVSNSAQYMAMSNTAYTNSGRAPLYTQAQIDLYANATDRVKYPNHNWLNDVFKSATTQNHYIGMSGGVENTTFRVGLGITTQPGVMIGFDYKKYTLDLNLSSKVHKRVTIGTNIQMRYANKVNPIQGATDQFLSTLAQSPLYPASYQGKWIKRAYSNEQGNKNPVGIVGENVSTHSDDYYMQGYLFANVDLFKGLTWENKAGANFETSKYNSFHPVIPTYYFNDMSSAGLLDVGTPGLNAGRADNIYTVTYSQLNYKQTFGNHNISAIGGASQEQNKSSFIDAGRLQYTTNLLRELNAGPTSGMVNDGSSYQWALSSFYGNANYDYKDKYLLGSSVRYDGTSRLPSTTRWGLFYSFSGAWRISKENFMKDISWIDDLKIRGSWGKLGNQNIGNYPYQPALTGNSYAFAGNVSSGYTAQSLVDPSLTWETTRVGDIGLDLKAFNNKLSFSLDYYDKYTYDILRSSQVPLWLGLTPPTINNGAVGNKGLEFSAQYRGTINKELSFIIGASLQTYSNSLKHYGKTEINGNTIREEGKPLDSYYIYQWDGIFQSQSEIDASAKQPVTPTPGDLKFKDINGDKVINDKDRVIVNGKYPAYQYSINLDLKWRDFDISAMAYSSVGQKIYVNGWGIEPFRQGSVPTTAWLNAWTPTNHSNTMPKIYLADGYAAVQNYQSTYFLKDASFIRLKNIQLGYNVPTNILKKLNIQALRLYLAADNVFTVSKFPGLDPERVGDGTYVNYPQNKTFTFGAKIQF